MSEATRTRATPMRIERRAEKLSILEGVIRDALKKHSTYEALADSVSMRVLDRWSVKCPVRSKRFATRGKARLTNAQNYNTHVRVCVCVCVCVCV